MQVGLTTRLGGQRGKRTLGVLSKQMLERVPAFSRPETEIECSCDFTQVGAREDEATPNRGE